jgi:hypothetical protein
MEAVLSEQECQCREAQGGECAASSSIKTRNRMERAIERW